MEIIMLILAIICTGATVYGVTNKDKIITSLRKLKSRKPDEIDRPSTEPVKPSILIEPKSIAKLYRAKNKNNSYLSLYVMLVNTGSEIIVIREIEGIMSDEIGILQKEKINIQGFHKGLGANYFLGNTPNLLPLSLPGNTSIDAYIVFEFSNVEIKISSLLLKIITSKGKLITTFNTDIED